jgi:hypothetical protein
MLGQVNNQINIQARILPDRNISSGMPRRFIFFSFLLLLIAVLIYLGLTLGYKPALNNSIGKLKSELESLSNKINPAQQENLIAISSQVSNIKDLLADHVFASKLFLLLEKNTHKNVAYRSLETDILGRELTIDGVAGSYNDLVAQLTIYEKADGIEKVLLQSSKLEGKVVSFRVILTIKPEVISL